MKALRSAHRSPWPLAAFFVLAGVIHFLKPGFYLRIMPPYIPYQREVVYASGVAEIVGGVAVALPALRRPWSRWGLVALLLAVFPANVHAALHPEAVGGGPVATTIAWVRLPVQGLFIAWVLSATAKRSRRWL
jgi:uncharacterized membrane protein